jgi:hypothetical protein
MEAIAWRHIPGDSNLQNVNASESVSEVACTYFDDEVYKTDSQTEAFNVMKSIF